MLIRHVQVSTKRLLWSAACCKVTSSPKILSQHSHASISIIVMHALAQQAESCAASQHELLLLLLLPLQRCCCQW